MQAHSSTEGAALAPARAAPGPSGLPFFGQTAAAWRDPIGLFLRSQAAHGDVVRLRFGPFDYFLVNDVAAIKRVLVDNAANYEKSRSYAGLRVLLGEGLLTSEGEFWRRQRRLAQPAFHRERLAALAGAMAAEVERMRGRWAGLGPGAPVDVHAEMMRLTFAIVGRALLSADLDGDASAVGEALGVCLAWANRYVESFAPAPLWVPTPSNLRFRRARRTLDALVYRVIAERRGRGEPGDDLLGMLMAASVEGGAMSDRQLRDELLTLVLAGHETTANLLAFAFHALSSHPHWRAELEGEVDAALAGRAPGFDDLPRLRLTRAALDETLRLYPPVWTFERQAKAPDVLGGFRVPKGSLVGIAPYVLHRHPAHWADPEGFDPTRFLPERAAARHKFAYLPFGGGPRTCIGNAFALTEATIVLAMVLQRHRLERDPARPLRLDPAVTMRPAGGLFCRLYARAQGSSKAATTAS
ncbi:MAG TPA: cytochrome P450 [Polyangiaceae bacterium]|nr:cytochrome P450 [Polyangiaceae bacterium]